MATAKAKRNGLGVNGIIPERSRLTRSQRRRRPTRNASVAAGSGLNDRRGIVLRASMSYLLQQQIDAARRRIRRLLLVHGASRVLAVVVTTAIVLAGDDYMLRFDDRGVRVICGLALLGVAAWVVLRYLLPAVRQPLGDVAVGQGIERHFKGLGESLSSPIAFLHQSADDPLAGSAALRQAAVAQAEAAVAPLDWRAAVDRRPALRAAALAALACLVAAGLIAASPNSARLAAGAAGQSVWRRCLAAG